MKILVTGSTGLVGTALVSALLREGHAVRRLLRPESKSPLAGGGIPVRWNLATGELEGAAAGTDAVVNLAGASIASGRWSEKRKALLRTSRVGATRQLVASLARLDPPPRVLISASAIGYYGNRGNELLDEESAPGDDFLGKLCVEWEAEAAKAEATGMRVVHMRFGIIMAKHGGALQKMLPPFRLGAGGRLGSGQQWMSWVMLEDIVSMIRFSLENDSLRGPMNAVAPQPARNLDFTRALARALHRPAIFPAPAIALRLALGEMADALLLSSQRVLPQKLEKFGYRFLHSDLASALAAVLSPV